MADQCYMIEDPLFTSETWLLTREQGIAEAGTFGEALWTVRSASLAEAGAFGDAIGGIRTFTFGDAAAFGESFGAIGQPVAILSDALRAHDRLLGSRSAMLADVLSAADALTVAARAALAESGRFVDTLAPLGHPEAMLSESAALRDRLSSVRGDALAEAGAFADGFTSRRGATLSESAVLADLLTAGSKPIVVLRDAAVLGEAYTARATPRAALADDGWFEDRYLLPPAPVMTDGHTGRRVGAATGWTANTDTWAMSRYTDWPINSLAVIGGGLYGAADDGLHRLDAADDAGTPIDAHVMTGTEDYGNELVKGAHFLYAGALTDGLLQVTIDAAPRGAPAFYTYQFEPRLAGDYAPQRAKLGRGIRSRYMRFTVGNAAGADFTIDTLSVAAEPGTRRV